MLQECSILRVAKVFFDEPTKPHYLMEISRKCKIAHTSVIGNLIILRKESIIKRHVEKKGQREFPYFTAHLESEKYKAGKQLSNLLFLGSSGLIERLRDATFPKAIILFGSYSRGEDTEESDIDLFVEAKKVSIDLGPYEKILKRRIQLHFKEKFRDLPEELRNNIINGHVLRGYLEAY